MQKVYSPLKPIPIITISMKFLTLRYKGVVCFFSVTISAESPIGVSGAQFGGQLEFGENCLYDADFALEVEVYLILHFNYFGSLCLFDVTLIVFSRRHFFLYYVYHAFLSLCYSVLLFSP